MLTIWLLYKLPCTYVCIYIYTYIAQGAADGGFRGRRGDPCPAIYYCAYTVALHYNYTYRYRYNYVMLYYDILLY